MKALKINQTVLLAKPESAHLSASSDSTKSGLTRSAGPTSTHLASTATNVTAITPMAGLGSGSTTNAAITPAKMAK